MFTYLNNVIDLVFFADIVINFRTSYIDNYGEEQTDLVAIAKNYLSFMFWVDLFATVPVDELISFILKEEDPKYQLFGLLKFGRILKLKKII